MDELKKLIEENREMFDSAVPSAGHMDKFYEMLNKQPKKVVSYTWSSMLKVAAVAVLVILSGLYVKDKLFEMLPEAPVAQTNPEFSETKQYYIHQVSLRLDKIENMDEALTEEQQDLLTEEMTKMDNMYKKLRHDLKAMPNDPRIMQAMLQHYQMKMEVLNRIITDLNNVQQLNIPNHESIEL